MSLLSNFLEDLADRVPTQVRPRKNLSLVKKNRAKARIVGPDLEELELRIVPTLLGQQLFPLDNPWNQNIANAPVAANSPAIIAHIGSTIGIHPDWGADSSSNGNDPLYGIPFNVVHGNSVTKVNVIIDGYPSESDIEPVPIPANAVIEGDYQNGPNLNGVGARGDSHLIIWDEDNNIAYELYGTERPNDKGNTTGKWEARQETVWNMNTDSFRELGYTSADAAGLSILAGLVRPDEGLPVSQGGQGAIDHALRFTLPSRDINPQYIYPASHVISVSPPSSTSLPMGARLRLENNPTVNALIAQMGPEAQIVATAMQQYGLILADDGSPMYVTGASGSVNANNQLSLVWNMDDVLGLESLTAGDFQVVDLTPVVSGVSASTALAGSTVTITGQNFSGAAGHLSVFFGATPSSSVTYISDTEITAVVPNGTGTVNVTVQSGVNEVDNNDSPGANVNAPIFGYGTSATSSADLFTYSTIPISGTSSSVSFGATNVASSVPDTVTLMVVDVNGDAVSGLAGSAFNLGLSGGTSTGTFSSVTETSTAGTYTATFTGEIAGSSSTLTTSVDGTQISTEPMVQVTPGALSGSESSVSFASPTDVAGTTDDVTIVLKDAAGNAITGVGGSDFAFSMSGGTSTGTMGTIGETETKGTYTGTFMGQSAGTASSLVVTVGGVPLSAEPKVTVQKGPVSGSTSTASFAGSTVASQKTDKLTIVVEDAGGNPIVGLASSAFVLALTGGSTGTFTSVAATLTPGTYSTTFTGAIVGTASTLTIKVNGVELNSTPTIQVTPGVVGPVKSTVSVAASAFASGTTDLITIAVKDPNKNPITGLPSSAFVLALTVGKSTVTFGSAIETSTPGTYTVLMTGVNAGAGTLSTLTVKVDGVLLATQPKITVRAGAVSATNSRFQFIGPTVAVGATDRLTITVEDAAGNPIDGLANKLFTFALSGGTSAGTFGIVTESTTLPGVYTVLFKGVTAGTASDLTIAVDGVALTMDPTIQVK